MFWKTSPPASVTFATACWEIDWRTILLDPDYLRIKQIGNHAFPFAEKLLIINNVSNREKVVEAAQKCVEKGVLDRYVISEDHAQQILAFFQLDKSALRPNAEKTKSAEWVYWNALAPLSALYFAQSAYLLYMTGDVRVEKKISWIEKALHAMQKNPSYKVANLTWNEKYAEAKRESYKKEGAFFVSRSGFSDQMFLVKKEDFCQPIYGDIHPESSHFPNGDVWERRAYSALRYRNWERLTYRHASYWHESF